MNFLDLLSGAPRTMIFEKSSNKTNLGGILTLIYLIIVLLLSAYYIYDYEKNNKYEISYTYDYQYLDEYEFVEKRYFDENYNPDLNYSFRLVGDEFDTFNESNFLIFYYNNSNEKEDQFVNFHEVSNSTVYDLDFYIFYICEDIIDGECIIREEDIAYLNTFYLDFNYSGFKLVHQNEESPIIRDYVVNRFHFSLDDKITITRLRWKNIIYREEQGIFDNLLGEPKEIIGGEFLDPIISTIAFKDFPEGESLKNDGLKLLTIINTVWDDPKNNYDIYTRKKKTIFSPIANICSLSLTIYNGFIILFCTFYSNNFDSYKIIEKILSKNEKGEKKNIDYHLNNNLNKGDIELLEDKNKLIELPEYGEKKESLIDSQADKEIIINEKSHVINVCKTILPKLHFYDFFFNCIYSRKCLYSKKQELISSCREIISKYFSIDYILYNQIMLENLMKDYKWNDSKLSNILNNDLIKKLNT